MVRHGLYVEFYRYGLCSSRRGEIRAAREQRYAGYHGSGGGHRQAFGCPRIVFTGGEPLLQQAALAQLCDVLGERYHIEIETNGTVALLPAFSAHVDQINVSPKLAHSGNDNARINAAVLASYARDERAWFKFVVAVPDDVDEVLDLQERFGIASARIFLMPEGVTSAVLREREAWLSPLCLRHGFAMSDRLHIHLYGDSRGT